LLQKAPIQAAPGKGREAVRFAGINHLVYGALTIAVLFPRASTRRRTT
jgi:hypothetical protein